jgi:hypothetical protein
MASSGGILWLLSEPVQNPCRFCIGHVVREPQ